MGSRRKEGWISVTTVYAKILSLFIQSRLPSSSPHASTIEGMGARKPTGDEADYLEVSKT